MEVRFNNVNFYYDKKSKIKILDSINLKIKANTVIGITGKNGSGKTTLLELINALSLPTSGKIMIDNMVINKKKEFDKEQLRKMVGYIVQDAETQLFNKTVEEELCYSCRFLKKTVDQQKLLTVLDMVGLDESYLVKNPLLLSHGEKRKVAIASTLVLDSDIIMLDEPTNGLDGKSIKSIERLIKYLKSVGKIVIVVSRDVEFLHKVSDDIVIMHEGKIVLQGNKYDVFKNIQILKQYEIPVPKIIEFSTLVLNKKNIKIGYRDEINDLLKDIYRYVR